MQHSESIAALAKALAAAQGEIENAARNATNPHFRSTYADLAEIINTSRPVLARHGLAIVQFLGMNDGRLTVETIITHESGEWMSGTAESPMQKQDPQAVGSAATYLRRYALAAVCKMAQEDDDGSSASRERAPERRAEPEPTPNGNGGAERCSLQQAALIDKLVRSHVISNSERRPILSRLVAGTLSKDDASKCVEWLMATVKERKAAEKAEKLAGVGAGREPGSDDE